MKSLLMVSLLCLTLLACRDRALVSDGPIESAQNSPYASLILDAKQVSPVQLSYTPIDEPREYYFTHEGQVSDHAVEKGFVRKVLGKMADGRVVVQDFYSGSLKPQTSPFILIPHANEQTFNQSVLDSRVIWYDNTAGEITSTADFKAGVQQGWLDVYQYNQLVAQLKEEQGGMAIRFFSPDEKIWGEAHILPDKTPETPNDKKKKSGYILNKLVFFHPNGQVMSEMMLNAQHQPTGARTYDAQGKPTTAEHNAKNNEILLRRFGVLLQRLPVLMAR